MTHVRKLPPGQFRKLKRGEKRHDFLEDRGFMVDHRIFYREWDPGEAQYTGDELMVTVTDVTRGPDGQVPRGWAVVSISLTPIPVMNRADVDEQRRRSDARGAEDL